MGATQTTPSSSRLPGEQSAVICPPGEKTTATDFTVFLLGGVMPQQADLSQKSYL